MTAKTYLKLKWENQNKTYIRKNNKGYYLINGVEVPEEQVKLHKLPLVITGTDIPYQNSDTTKDYLYK